MLTGTTQEEKCFILGSGARFSVDYFMLQNLYIWCGGSVVIDAIYKSSQKRLIIIIFYRSAFLSSSSEYPNI